MSLFKLDKPVKKSELDLLYYEIRLFNNLVLINLNSSDITNKTIKNACLESFLVHTRNLIDFLEDKRYGHDDLTCIDFRDGSNKKVIAIQTLKFSDLRIKINKHLSHITKERLDAKPAWNIYNTAKLINKQLRSFFMQLSDEYFPTEGARMRLDFMKLLKIK